MKALLLLLAAIVVPTFAFAKEGWLDDYEKAAAQAKAENKKILLDFTGSDWCGWCMKLDKEVFSTPEWKAYAEKNFVLVEVDFPRRTKLPARTQQQNERLSNKYGVQGFPTVVILSPAGRKKGEVGYVEGGPRAFIRAVEHAR